MAALTKVSQLIQHFRPAVKVIPQTQQIYIFELGTKQVLVGTTVKRDRISVCDISADSTTPPLKYDLILGTFAAMLILDGHNPTLSLVESLNALTATERQIVFETLTEFAGR